MTVYDFFFMILEVITCDLSQDDLETICDLMQFSKISVANIHKLISGMWLRLRLKGYNKKTRMRAWSF